MTNDDADQAFEALHDAQRAAQMLYMDLRDAGQDKGAEAASLRATRLQNEIDNLLNKELQDWQAGAEALIPALTKAADDAKGAVDQVEEDIASAEKVVAAMSALDKAISTAMKFVG